MRPFRGFNQFQRIGWHWAEINRVALGELSALAAGAQHFVRLEDLRDAAMPCAALYEFLGLPCHDE